jgi:hypothetical protein
MLRSAVPKGTVAMAQLIDLEVLTDEGGSVVLGWLASNVLYVRFTGRLSAELGEAYVARLQTLLANMQSVRYFSDASALHSYDLLARSAFVRFVFANRSVLSSMVMLTWSEALAPSPPTVAATLGNGIDVLTDAKEFEARLLQAAPLARQKLDPKTWQRKPLSPVAR